MQVLLWWFCCHKTCVDEVGLDECDLLETPRDIDEICMRSDKDRVEINKRVDLLRKRFTEYLHKEHSVFMATLQEKMAELVVLMNQRCAEKFLSLHDIARRHRILYKQNYSKQINMSCFTVEEDISSKAFYALNRICLKHRGLAERVTPCADDYLREVFDEQIYYLNNYMENIIQTENDVLLEDIEADDYKHFINAFSLFSYEKMVSEIESIYVNPTIRTMDKDLADLQTMVDRLLCQKKLLLSMFDIPNKSISRPSLLNDIMDFDFPYFLSPRSSFDSLEAQDVTVL